MIHSFLQSRTGKEVLINKGGPYARRGKLLRVKEDYVVIQTRDGSEIFYQTEHMKSISMDTYSERMTHSETCTSASLADDADHFDEVLHRLRYYRVDINQGSPEALKGILMRLFEDSVLLIDQHHLIQVMKRHIVTISLRSVERVESEGHQVSLGEKVESEGHQVSSGERDQHTDKREETAAVDEPVIVKQPIASSEQMKEADPPASSDPPTRQLSEQLKASVEEHDQGQASHTPDSSLAATPFIPEERAVYPKGDLRSYQPRVRRRSKRSRIRRRKEQSRVKMRARSVFMKTKVTLASLSFSAKRNRKLQASQSAAFRNRIARHVPVYMKHSFRTPHLSHLFIASSLVFAPYSTRKKASY